MASCSFDTLSLQLIRSFKVKKVKVHPKIYKTANVNGKSLMINKRESPTLKFLVPAP